MILAFSNILLILKIGANIFTMWYTFLDEFSLITSYATLLRSQSFGDPYATGSCKLSPLRITFQCIRSVAIREGPYLGPTYCRVEWSSIIGQKRCNRYFDRQERGQCIECKGQDVRCCTSSCQAQASLESRLSGCLLQLLPCSVLFPLGHLALTRVHSNCYTFEVQRLQ